ncbi:hypothetical protein [Melittangium boletus]|uniref:Uncharacterized protein n=1 Tax=Melittangium boletus DSM 14713 TaxID=1294270 RepID=A0A250IGY0_9BACT|nr:hypothetical protein [Melittangium boletus]ATB30186.1 hypothetical protein MEBOL_003641 [Melittangium boletus DSM 14713]
MSDEKTEREHGPGPFRLLRRCDEVEPRLGELYEAVNVFTGRPALTLFPKDSVQWQPMGPRRGWFYFSPGADSVTVEVERQSDPEQTMDWVNLLTLMSLVGHRVEDSPQVKVHLAGRPPNRWTRWTYLALWILGSRGWGAASGIALFLLCLGVWTGRPGGPLESQRADVPPEFFSFTRAPALAKLEGANPALISYPLPSKPFVDQAVPPCETRKGAVEIKNGCWIELAKKPPCFDTQAEYQGKCYLPVAKKESLPQAVTP